MSLKNAKTAFQLAREYDAECDSMLRGIIVSRITKCIKASPGWFIDQRKRRAIPAVTVIAELLILTAQETVAHYRDTAKLKVSIERLKAIVGKPMRLTLAQLVEFAEIR